MQIIGAIMNLPRKRISFMRLLLMVGMNLLMVGINHRMAGINHPMVGIMRRNMTTGNLRSNQDGQ